MLDLVGGDVAGGVSEGGCPGFFGGAGGGLGVEAKLLGASNDCFFGLGVGVDAGTGGVSVLLWGMQERLICWRGWWCGGYLHIQSLLFASVSEGLGCSSARGGARLGRWCRLCFLLGLRCWLGFVFANLERCWGRNFEVLKVEGCRVCDGGPVPVGWGSAGEHMGVLR